MRDAVDAYVERGGRAARFAGNFMWQTRLEDDGARQVCYKYRARAEDPAYRGGDVDARHQFLGGAGDRPAGRGDLRAQCHRRPLCRLGRLRAARRARLSRSIGPEHWAFSGTGLYYGDLLGADSHVFGYEVDGLDHVIRNGLPEADAAQGGAPAGLEILALGMASQVEESADLPAGFLNDEDGRFNAETLYGTPSDENLDKVKRGNGMIVNFKRGKGEVFHAGSCEWVAGPAAPRRHGREGDEERARPLCRRRDDGGLADEPPAPCRRSAERRPSNLFYVTRLRRPLIDRAEGIYIWDVDGRRYIDGSSGPVAVNIGHGNRNVLDAMKRQMDKATFAYRLHFENEPAEELARALAARMPGGLDRIFFVSGGSEAVESCIKLARQWAVATGQPKPLESDLAACRPIMAALRRAGRHRRRHADRHLRRPDAR